MNRKLTAKQKHFADNYVKSGNATQSAIDAGYSKRTARSIGQENLTKPDIKSYIDERMQQIESDKIMDATEAMQLLTRIARAEEQETVVVATKYDVETVERPPDMKARISALKEILKRYPENDKLAEQQVRKLKAEAAIAEGRAAEYSDNEGAGEVVIVDDIPGDEESEDQD